MRPSDALRKAPDWCDPSYRALLDASPFLVWIAGVDGKCTFFNRSWLEFRGRRMEEEAGDGWTEGVHPADLPQCLRTYLSAFEAREPFRMEYRIRRADGSYRWIVDAGTPLFGDGGAFAGYIGSCLDIEDQKRAEEALSRLSDSHALILAAAGEGILGLDAQGHHTFVNPAAERLLGWSSEELIGRESHPAWHHSRPDGSSYDGEECPILRSLRDGEVHHITHEVFWRRDGTRFLVDYVSTPIREGGRITGAVVIFRDVTEVARLESVAASVEMTNSVGWVLSAVRHELGNPVNSVKTALHVVLANLERFPQEKVRSFLERSLDELGRVEELLASLRSYTMFERVTVVPVELPELVARFARIAGDDFLRKGIRLEVQLPEERACALADPRAVHQVLLNLLANAGEALEATPDPVIVLKVACEGDHVVLQVIDNGVGIAPEVREHLFEPFRTTKPGGTGLGLVITRKTLARMDASISIDSEVGGGTTVTLRFRCAEVSAKVAG